MNEAIIDSGEHRTLDVLLMVLLNDTEETLLPEILQIFGRDKMIKFLDIFGGTTVRVPSRVMLEKAMTDVDIYVSMVEDESHQTRDRLAVKYAMSRERVQKRLAHVENVVMLVEGIRAED